MADTLDKLDREKSYWIPSFQYNWTKVGSMMQQSEITASPQEHNQQEESDTCRQSHKDVQIPQQWNAQDLSQWKGWGFVESDLSTNGSVPNPYCRQRFKKTCRRILCVLLLMSFFIAVVAAVGLSVFLTQFGDRFIKQTEDHRHIVLDIPEDVHLSVDQQNVLTKIFCGTVEDLLIKSEFPVTKGLKNCSASILYIENTGSIHIEMHATPVDGYTIKEKILRVLSEKISSNQKNRNEGETTPYIEPESITDGNINIAVTPDIRSPTMLHNIPTDQVTGPETKDTNIFNSTTDEITSTEEPLLSPSTEYVQTSTETLISSLPKLKSTTNSLQATEYTNVVATTLSTESVDYMVTEQITKRPISVKSVTTSPDHLPGDNIHIPVPRKLFNPSINKEHSNLAGNQTPSYIKSSDNGSTKVVESLMAGGMIRLPLKTNSNFRFLFSSNPVASGQVKQSSENGVGVKVVTRRPVNR